MIYLLIVILLVKYRYAFVDLVRRDDKDELSRILETGAGLEYQAPQKQRHLRVVK